MKRENKRIEFANGSTIETIKCEDKECCRSGCIYLYDDFKDEISVYRWDEKSTLKLDNKI